MMRSTMFRRYLSSHFCTSKWHRVDQCFVWGGPHQSGSNMCNYLTASFLQTYAEMDPTTAALEKEHEAVRGGNICITHWEKKLLCIITMLVFSININNKQCLSVFSFLSKMLLLFSDHKSKICGQDPDWKLWDWCMVLLSIPWGLWKTAQALDLWILPKVYEVWEDFQIPPGQFTQWFCCWFTQ